jgi:hypothetical protein
VWLKRFFDAVFNGPVWLNFLLMGVFLGLFGWCSANLLGLFMANFDLFTRYGAMAVADGGAWQTAELVFWGYLSLAWYVMFKGCLDGLLWRFRHDAAKGPG